jgi:hypothetical protein
VDAEFRGRVAEGGLNVLLEVTAECGKRSIGGD